MEIVYLNVAIFVTGVAVIVIGLALLNHIKTHK